jgi:hypothetical protein
MSSSSDHVCFRTDASSCILTVCSNIVDQYYKSGYIWEQYKDTEEGDGKGSHPFTGWSALVVLMMADKA